MWLLTRFFANLRYSYSMEHLLSPLLLVALAWLFWLWSVSSPVQRVARRGARFRAPDQLWPSHWTVFPNLVIYHEFRDFGHGPRDKILLSWQVTSPWFLEIPRKMGKTHYFSQKYQNFSHFFKKIRDFSAILRFIARDYSDFLGVFLLVIFVTFLPWSRDFQEKSFGNTVVRLRP